MEKQPSRLGIAPSDSKSKRKLVARSDGRQVRRLVAYLDPTLAKQLERYAVDTDQGVSSAIVEAVRILLIKATP